MIIKVYLCDEISPISATVIDPKLNLSISFRNKKPAESRGAAPCRIIEQGNNEIWEGDIKRGMIQYVNNSQITEVQIQGNRGNLNIVFFLQNFVLELLNMGNAKKSKGSMSEYHNWPEIEKYEIQIHPKKMFCEQNSTFYKSIKVATGIIICKQAMLTVGSYWRSYHHRSDE